MKSKVITLDNQYNINVFKRKGTKSIRLSVSSNGEIRLTIPKWLPYFKAQEFIVNQAEFIKKNYQKKIMIKQDQLIGRYHRLSIIKSEQITDYKIKITDHELIVQLNPKQNYLSESIQLKITEAANKVLKKEAQNYLPQRLQQLSKQINYNYNGLKIKKLKRRWGSCDNHQIITFNYYLMTLPIELIDYVIFHELTHTKVLNHSPEFWQLLEQNYPNSQNSRKKIKDYQPQI
jgi:predicted metal-dependent hydrolase